MKTKTVKKFILMGCLALFTVTQVNSQQSYSGEPVLEKKVPNGCSIITIAKGDSIFFAGNDDYINPDSYYWVEQGDSSKYGVVWIGTPDNPQQGVNEKGLAYDANGLPSYNVNPHPERIPVPGGYEKFCMQIMHECSTVQEVVDWANTHQHYPFMQDQLHFADAKGDAVIISAGKDGELSFSRKGPGDGFLVSTNFNVANPSNSFDYPCWRYDLAQKLLEQLMDKEGPVNHNDITNVMNAVHMEGASWTIETMIADLVTGTIYIYYFYQYDHPVILNVKSELANPHEPGALSKFFPEDVRKEAAKRFKKNTADLRINKVVGILWPVLIIVSLILFFITATDFRRGFKFWLPAVLVLGPFALIVRLITDLRRKKGLHNYAAIEVLGDIIPVVISYTLGTSLLVIRAISGNAPWQFQLTMIIVLPLLVGILYHEVFLAPISKKNFARFLFQRLPHVLTTTLLALGGIIPVALPMVNKSLTMSLLIPLSPLSVMTWWAIVVIGALPGGLLIYLFEYWAVKKGIYYWIISAGEEGEANTLKWSKIWWWFLISIVIFITGLIIGVSLTK